MLNTAIHTNTPTAHHDERDAAQSLADSMAAHGAQMAAFQSQLVDVQNEVWLHKRKEMILCSFLDDLVRVLPVCHPSSLRILLPIVQSFTVRYQNPGNEDA